MTSNSNHEEPIREEKRREPTQAASVDSSHDAERQPPVAATATPGAASDPGDPGAPEEPPAERKKRLGWGIPVSAMVFAVALAAFSSQFLKTNPVDGAVFVQPQSDFDEGPAGEKKGSAASPSGSTRISTQIVYGDGNVASSDNGAGSANGGAASAGDAVVSSVRPAGAFSRLGVSAPANVTVKRGATPSVEIRASAEAQKHLVASVSGGRLDVRAEGSFSMHSAIEIAITTVEPLQSVEASAAARIDAGELAADAQLELSGASRVSGHGKFGRVKADISGTSELELSGSADSLDLEASGASHANLSTLSVSQGSINLSGVSDATVSARDSVRGEISGVSRARILGNPARRDISNDGMGGVSFENGF